MKTTFTTLFILLSITFAKAQDLELPFFDDFSNDYENWTTISVEGDLQWHLSYDDGIDGSKCARIYATNSSQENDDWLVTNPINTEGASNIRVTFYYWYYGDNLSLQFYYTNNIGENFEQTEWTEITPSNQLTPWNWNEAMLEIETPEEQCEFAFRYESGVGDDDKIMIDNFNIISFEPVVFENVGTTEHFEFYTNISEETDYWLEIKDGLENNFQKYCGIWNLEGKEDFIDKNYKTKIYYTEKNNIPFVNETTPETKSGFFDRETKIIYLSPLNTPEKQEYYENMEGLAINTFAGYAKKHQLFRDQNGYDVLPDYYIEGFGLYEQGYHPRVDSIRSFRSQHPDALTHEDLDAMDVFSKTSQKDIIVSYVEGQIIGLLDYFGTAPYGSYPPRWNNFLVYFYDTTDVVRIKKYASSENFDIYCSSRDTMFIDSFFIWLERPRQFYINSYQIEVNRKFNLVIYYDEKTGMDMTGYGNWNGGAGGFNISPHNFWGGPYDGYDWLLGHEFGHVYNSIMYPEMPSGFYHEGMANLSGGMATGGNEEIKSYDDLWKVEYVFNFYNDRFQREPTLEELITNAHAGDPGFEYGADCYFFGYEFMRYLRDTQGYLKIKEFFQSGLDFGVFNISYEEVEQGYIERLRYLHSIRDYNSPVILINRTLNVERGKSKIITSNNLQANDQEVDDKELVYKIKSAPLYGIIEKVDNLGIKVYKFTEEEIQNNKIRYTNMGGNETSDFFIFELTDRTFFLSNKQFNFTITNPNGISELFKNQTNFQIYPNPVASESKISFTLKKPEKVELAIFDLQGKKLSTISNQTLTTGYHEFLLDKYFKKKGIYFCRLKTNNNIATLKFVVE